jgi:hypothetical protein
MAHRTRIAGQIHAGLVGDEYFYGFEGDDFIVDERIAKALIEDGFAEPLSPVQFMYNNEEFGVSFSVRKQWIRLIK